MESKSFLDGYQVTDIEKDPLPIKVLRNAITKDEIEGQAAHWGFEYLDQRSCPLGLMQIVIGKLRNEIRQTDFSQCAEAADDSLDGSEAVDNEVRYEPLKLMRAIVKKLDEICVKEKEEYQDSVDGVVEPPDMQPHVYGVSYNNIKNSRRYMEDRMTILPRMDRIFDLPSPLSYFAVFDGHNGAEAAAYSAAQLHQCLIRSMNQQEDIISSISDAIESLDETFIQKCRSGKVKSGSTVVLSLIVPGKLYVAWLGDSQAVLVKQNEVNNLVTPHKPERKDEIDRIKSLGGEVIQMHDTYRVNGNLAVSRAIGDADQKTFIISTPDIKMLELEGSEEFLILACDGLWDEISPDAAAQIVRRQIVSDPKNVSAISQKLVQQAKQKGSQDNISVIVVFLEPVESIKNRYEGLLEPTVESEVAPLKQTPEPFEGIPMQKFIEHGIPELNGHAKEGDQLVDFLSFGSSRESGVPMTGEDIGNQSGDEILIKKEVEEELSDAESDDEWQFEKPSNQGVGPIFYNQQGQLPEPMETDDHNVAGVPSDLQSSNAERGIEFPHNDGALEPKIRPDVVEDEEEEHAEEQRVDVVENELLNRPDSVESKESIQILMPARNEMFIATAAESFDELVTTSTNPFFTEEAVAPQPNPPVMADPILPQQNDQFPIEQKPENLLTSEQNLFAVDETIQNNQSPYDQIEEVLNLERANLNESVQSTNPFGQDVHGEILVQEENADHKELFTADQPMIAENEFIPNNASFSNQINEGMNLEAANLNLFSVGEGQAFTTISGELTVFSDDSKSTLEETDQNFAQSSSQVDKPLIMESDNITEPLLPQSDNNPFTQASNSEELFNSGMEQKLIMDEPMKPDVEGVAQIDLSSNDQINEMVCVEPVNISEAIHDAKALPHGEFNLLGEQQNLVVDQAQDPPSNNEIVFLQSENLNETIKQGEPTQEFSNDDLKTASSSSVDKNWNVVASEAPVDSEKFQPITLNENISSLELQSNECVSKPSDPILPSEALGSIGEAENDNAVAVSESLSKPSDLVIPTDSSAEISSKPKQEKKPSAKGVKSPVKPEATLSRARVPPTKSSPTKPEAASKVGGLVNGKSTTTVPRSAPKSTTGVAPRPAGTKVAATGITKSTTGAPRVGAATAARSAAPKSVNGVDAKSSAPARSAPSTSTRTRPTTAPAAPKPAVPKPAASKTTATVPSTTSPKRVPPVGGSTTTAAKPLASRPATASTTSKVGDAAAKPASSVTRTRPKPATTTTAAAKPAVGGDVKKTTTLKPTTSTAKPASTLGRPPPRTIPMSQRMAPPKPPAATTTTRPVPPRTATKPATDSSKPTGAMATKSTTRTVAPPSKTSTATKKVESSASVLKSKKPSPTAIGKSDATSKTGKSAINKKVAAAANKEAELIQQNGLNSNEGNTGVNELNGINGAVNGSVNGGHNGIHGETEKQDAIKENGVHLDDEHVDHDDTTPPPLTPPTENFLASSNHFN